MITFEQFNQTFISMKMNGSVYLDRFAIQTGMRK